MIAGPCNSWNRTPTTGVTPEVLCISCTARGRGSHGADSRRASHGFFQRAWAGRRARCHYPAVSPAGAESPGFLCAPPRAPCARTGWLSPMAVLRWHRVSSFATSLAHNRTPGPSAVVTSAGYGPGLKQVEIVPPTQAHSAGSPWGPRTIPTLPVQSGEGRGRHITGTDAVFRGPAALAPPVRPPGPEGSGRGPSARGIPNRCTPDRSR